MTRRCSESSETRDLGGDARAETESSHGHRLMPSAGDCQREVGDFIISPAKIFCGVETAQGPAFGRDQMEIAI